MGPSMLDRIRAMLTPQQRRIIGAEAEQSLRDKHWNAAFEDVNAYLDQVALSCDPDNKEKAQRIILSKQLLQSVRGALVAKIEDGEMAKIEIEQLEARDRLRVFRR